MYVIKKSKDGQYYFILVVGNGEVLMTSEMYTQKHNAKSGVMAVISATVKIVNEDLRFYHDETGEGGVR